MIIAALLSLAACSNEIRYDATGQIETEEVIVSAEASGRIMALALAEGEHLEEGQCVGVIDSVLTHLKIRELESRMAGARARMVDVEGQLAPDRAQLASLKKDLKRYRTLLEKDAGTRKQVEDIENQITMLDARIAAQEQSLNNGNSSVKAELATYMAQEKQLYDQLGKCLICSPIDGTVLTRYVNAGESVTVGKPVFKIADLSGMYVRAYLTTDQLADVSLGDEVTVIPDDGSRNPRRYAGKVTWISETSEFTPKNIQTRNERADLVYAVKIALPEEDDFRMGMYAFVIL